MAGGVVAESQRARGARPVSLEKPAATTWRVTVLPGHTERVELHLTVDSTEPEVLRVIEQAAARNGVVLHREEPDE
jgi:aspartate-semialdehyde dehydrogenase